MNFKMSYISHILIILIYSNLNELEETDIKLPSFSEKHIRDESTVNKYTVNNFEVIE